MLFAQVKERESEKFLNHYYNNNKHIDDYDDDEIYNWGCNLKRNVSIFFL